MICCLVLLGSHSVLLNAQSAGPEKVTQDGPAQPTVTFKSRSELVIVPVIVTDHRGGHLSGLKKENFSLSENGSERSIALLDEVVANNERVVVHQPDQQVYSNTVAATSAKRLVIVALDTINTPANDQIPARKQILKFLAEGVDPNALISVVVLTPSGVKVIHDFTTDTSILIAAVSKVTGRSAFSEQVSAAADDNAALQSEVEQLGLLSDNTSSSAIAAQRQLAIRWTYDALTQIAQAYAAVPGRKSLIWVTGGFPFSLADNNNQVSGVAMNGDVSDSLWAYEQMWQALTHANFAVYPVDARGLVNPAVIQASTGARSAGAGKLALPNMAVTQARTHEASLDTFRDLAAMTGGKAFFGTNNLVKSFHDASDDSSSYYVLGFYLPKDEKPGWHDLKVKVNRSGTQVRARSGYLVPAKNEFKERTDDVRNAVLSPLDSTVLPLEVRWTGQTHSSGDKTTAAFQVLLKPTALTIDEYDQNHIKFEVIAVAKRSDGSIAASLQRAFEAHVKADNMVKIQTAGMHYDGKFELPAGNYMVRFVVEDRLAGRVGSVSAPLAIK